MHRIKKTSGFKEVLTSDAIDFVTHLHKKFNPERERLLNLRKERQKDLISGHSPQFLKETEPIRTQSWAVALTPADLEKRHVEITGPVEAKMMINALNSGADVFMADFEDALSPTLENILQGQKNLKEAVRHTLTFISADGSLTQGKKYELKEKTATLLVRPRGLHLLEKNFLVEGVPLSASLFDFGLYFFHNAHEQVKQGTAPYFYLPKLESHLEARLWNSVFNFAEAELGISQGTIRATVLIETILAAFEMEEILYELKEHSSGLNAGRWDYIFSTIKKFQHQKEFIFPDRSQITMTVPFMRAYTQLLVQTCHKRGAHAMGGMAAFVPSRKDLKANERAFAKVREDKEREVQDGFDGTWVAHPDLVPVAAQIFEKTLGKAPHQKHRNKEGATLAPHALLDFKITDGKITEAGLRNNVSVALQYLNFWLEGTGAAAIHSLMEDAATAEICRAQLWQWIHHGASLEDGRPITADLYQKIRKQELQTLNLKREQDVVELLDGLSLSDSFCDFLTLSAYAYL
ncbi:MAG: malate synthase A [Deltaproteobacteria bacterium]|nr:malate synthase A [Deltaproteobacteria bacterium]